MIDLWKGIYYAQKAEQNRLELNLDARETLLVYADAELDVPEKEKEMFLGDWTERFELLEQSENCKKYTYTYVSDLPTKTEQFLVRGEEMAECYCNGMFVDVSFWGPHKFEIGRFLKEGTNEIQVILTGNAANIYCDAEIPFGLKK